MNVDLPTSSLEGTQDGAPLPRSERWRKRLESLPARVRSALLFASGVGAALIALLLYQVLIPAAPQLTTREVSQSIAQALASVTPQPSLSSGVYRVIQPSLVLIQVQTTGKDGADENGLGSGVIVSEQGDILTSLHVVTQATSIQVTFAEGSQSSAQVVAEQPEHDIAVLRASQPPALLVPAVLGNPNAQRVGDEAFVVGNPFGLYSSMSTGVISGFDRSFQPENSAYRLEDMIQ